MGFIDIHRSMETACEKAVSPVRARNMMRERDIEQRLAFAEVKAPGRKPGVLQRCRHGKLRELGFPVFVLDAPEQIPGILSGLEGGWNDSGQENG